MIHNSHISVLISILLLVFILILVGSCTVGSKTTGAPEGPRGRGLEPELGNSPVLVRTLSLDSEALRIVTKLAVGDRAGMESQCVLLQLLGAKEEKGRTIGIRVFLNLPDADQETSYKTPNFVTTFFFGHSDTSIPEDVVFNIKNTIMDLGEELLEDLNRGTLSVTLVPFYVYPEDVPDPTDIQLQMDALQLLLDCQ